MSIELINHHTDKIVSTYLTGLRAGQAVYEANIDDRLMTAKARRAMSGEITGQFFATLEEFERMMAFAAHEVTESVLQGAKHDLDEITAQSIADSANIARESIRAQMSKDFSLFMKHFSKLQLTANMLMKTKGMSVSAASIAAKRVPKYTFDYTTTNGRSWKSKDFIRLSVRGYLIELINDLIVSRLVADGHGTVVIENTDPKHKHHELSLELIGEDGQNNYEQLKGRYFHPNSNSLVSYSKSLMTL